MYICAIETYPAESLATRFWPVRPLFRCHVHIWPRNITKRLLPSSKKINEQIVNARPCCILNVVQTPESLEWRRHHVTRGWNSFWTPILVNMNNDASCCSDFAHTPVLCPLPWLLSCSLTVPIPPTHQVGKMIRVDKSGIHIFWLLLLLTVLSYTRWHDGAKATSDNW